MPLGLSVRSSRILAQNVSRFGILRGEVSVEAEAIQAGPLKSWPLLRGWGFSCCRVLLIVLAPLKGQ